MSELMAQSLKRMDPLSLRLSCFYKKNPSKAGAYLVERMYKLTVFSFLMNSPAFIPIHLFYV